MGLALHSPYHGTYNLIGYLWLASLSWFVNEKICLLKNTTGVCFCSIALFLSAANIYMMHATVSLLYLFASKCVCYN